MLVKVQELREKVEQGVAKLGYEGDDAQDIVEVLGNDHGNLTKFLKIENKSGVRYPLSVGKGTDQFGKTDLARAI